MTTHQIRLSDKKYRRELATNERLPIGRPMLMQRFKAKRRLEAKHVTENTALKLQETLIGTIELNYLIKPINKWESHVSPNGEETVRTNKPAVSSSNSPIMVNSLISNMTRGEN
jgi:hypothetical protein